MYDFQHHFDWAGEKLTEIYNKLENKFIEKYNFKRNIDIISKEIYINFIRDGKEFLKIRFHKGRNEKGELKNKEFVLIYIKYDLIENNSYIKEKLKDSKILYINNKKNKNNEEIRLYNIEDVDHVFKTLEYIYDSNNLDSNKDFIKPIFDWIPFYEDFANKLLEYKNNRAELLNILYKIIDKLKWKNTWLNSEKYNNNNKTRLKDICPFTIFAMFNRTINDETRIEFIKEIINEFKINKESPNSLNGIPKNNAQGSWFFGYEYEQEIDDINNLWDVFEKAINYADDNANTIKKEIFIESYKKA